MDRIEKQEHPSSDVEWHGCEIVRRGAEYRLADSDNGGGTCVTRHIDSSGRNVQTPA